ncbi:ABC transporter ATP-binding protein [Halosquirtibacter laminarini]|uniref:ABC transporter ATP-binding protein n=1 Tax=Halosquirtibacter laminarini TaxID=3374600 RepID=A0AC61NJY8_9BACT|nr:ABC transporter ATP-binding protein [Prolixibacteraceae bacterium]
MLKASNIHKSFDTLHVLKGVSLEVAKGEVISIVGSSGAGKTTLLQVLGTLTQADKGEIWMNGKDISKLSSKKLSQFRNENIGFVFQFHHLLPEFTALENVSIPGWIAKRDAKEVEQNAIELLELLSLKDRLHHKPNELSGGERQRVAVARALINNPSIVLADEPSGSLDTTNKEELYELIYKLREKYNQTFVIVTHDKSFAQYTDRMLTIKDGVMEK